AVIMGHKPIRAPGGAGSAGRLGIGWADTDCFGGLAFLGDAGRTGTFFARFFLAFPPVLVFVPLVTLVTVVFFRFALVLRFAFFLTAIYSLPIGVSSLAWRGCPHGCAEGPERAHSRTWSGATRIGFRRSGGCKGHRRRP